MTGPALQTPEQRLAAIMARTDTPPAQTPEDRLAALDHAPPINAVHAAYKSGALRRANENANDLTMADVVDHPLGEAVSSALATPLAGVPGGRLLMSGAAKLGSPRVRFSDLQDQINEGTTGGGVAGVLGRGIGNIASLAITPASGWQAGGILGGADQLLNNDPNSTVGGRVLRGAAGAAGGAALGKGLDMGLAGIRALVSKGGEAAKNAALATRSAFTDPLYATVRNAPVQPLTPAMQAAYAHPDIAGIANDLAPLLQHQGSAPNTPTFIMDVRKGLSDWGHQLEKQGAVQDPSKPNILGQRLEHVNLLKEMFDQAADTQVPGFSDAVRRFAEESGPVNAQETGWNALKNKMSGGIPQWGNIGPKTEGNLAATLSEVAPQLRSHAGSEAANGILGAVRYAAHNGAGLRALSKAPSLLHTADAATGAVPLVSGNGINFGNVPNLPTALQRAILALGQSQAPQ